MSLTGVVEGAGTYTPAAPVFSFMRNLGFT